MWWKQAQGSCNIFFFVRDGLANSTECIDAFETDFRVDSGIFSDSYVPEDIK